MTDHAAVDSVARAEIEFRDQLLGKGWPDARHVAELVGTPLEQAETAYTIQARATGALLGVWSAPLHRFIYPDFQFSSSGALMQDVARLLAALPTNRDDPGGWRRAFWLYSPHPLLNDQTPADVFATAPLRVVEVAADEFLSDPEATW
ncbi:hypothetical protein EVC45_39095 [Paraburkholderia sp. UYCP14C]|uniref:hypothetical protein n=1 Tax=Paraburkholderia sp. UYCP14C TaxID=2511130 RepID=UPI0010221E2C|nr:hypothetical protein [Paraburkholderia sp. UYCP14C]RZF24388.1 hypothetical protein EVC45_39095 [Paraburkholderia sp. UYCP14C]